MSKMSNIPLLPLLRFEKMQRGRKRKLESLDSFETKHDPRLLAHTRASARDEPEWRVDAQRDEPFMFPDQRYPIDMDRNSLDDFTAPDLAGWQVSNNLSDEMARDVFRRNLRYISKDEFVSLLQKAADKFEAKYGKQNYSVFVSGGDKCKSNYWVMELLLTQTSMALHPPRHLVENVSGETPRGGLVVLPDDGLFSGVQMSSTLYQLEDGKSKPSPSGQKYAVVVAVTTQRALDAIGDRAEIFYGELLETAGDTAMKMGGKYRESAERGEFENSQPAIYFAHKVPDRASVPYAVQFFVGGCGFPQSESAKLDEMLAGSEFQCPIPPYKQTPSCLDQRFFAGGVRNNNKAKDWWLGDEFTQDDFSKYMSSTSAFGSEWKSLDDQLYKLGRSLANELTLPFVMIYPGDSCSSSFWATIQIASATNSYVSRPENVLSMQEAIDRSFNEMVVVFADDFMKTGQRMLATVDEFLNETNTDPKQVVVAVAFASPRALELFRERLPDVKILAGTWRDEPRLASMSRIYTSSPRCRAQRRVYPDFPINRHENVDK